MVWEDDRIVRQSCTIECRKRQFEQMKKFDDGCPTKTKQGPDIGLKKEVQKLIKTIKTLK